MASDLSQTTDSAYQSLLKQCQATDTELLFLRTKNDLTPRPSPTAIPCLWKHSQVVPLINDARPLLSEKEADRRVLMLVNPTREAPFTTDTFYCGLQSVEPKEIAPTHRHTATAIRFIIESENGFTSIEGKRFPMSRGDVVITPTGLWHHHENQGDKPILWLDSLDVPTFSYLPVHFAEKLENGAFDYENTDVCPFVFKWEDVRKALDSSDHLPWISRRYLKSNATELSSTIGASAERIHPNSYSPKCQETASSVYHVIQGSGYTCINDSEKILWQKGDTFCVPTWYKYQNFAFEETVYLYRVDDRPMLEALGFYRADAIPV